MKKLIVCVFFTVTLLNLFGYILLLSNGMGQTFHYFENIVFSILYSLFVSFLVTKFGYRTTVILTTGIIVALGFLFLINTIAAADFVIMLFSVSDFFSGIYGCFNKWFEDPILSFLACFTVLFYNFSVCFLSVRLNP